MEKLDISNYNNFFFIGVAGTGMSAIAQYLTGIGKNVSGSDRQFSTFPKIETQQQLEAKNIKCFPQDTSEINSNIEVVVVSTAIEPNVPEYQKALNLGLKIVMRSDLLAAISRTKFTVAVSGTSGKSTVTAMIYHILNQCKTNPSVISGAGLVCLQENGEIGNAVAGNGEILIIEADESDGSLVKYNPEIGIILNIDKDHKEIEDLIELFKIFKANTSKKLIVNGFQQRSKLLSQNLDFDFGFVENVGFSGTDFKQKGFNISFKINNIQFDVPQIGKHNAENTLAAVSAAFACGISIEKSAEAMKNYKGIYRRHQIIKTKNNITLIDDYAHNPAKLSASIKACQFEGQKLIVWFQPHGFVPTKFLKSDFIKEISESLRADDEIWMSEIYFAGGTVTKDISSDDLILEIKKNGRNAFFISNRNLFAQNIKSKLNSGDIVLLTGARDPSLSDFADEVSKTIFDN